jgi:ankyrin repeat protein
VVVGADSQELVAVLLAASQVDLINAVSLTGNTPLMLAAHHDATEDLQAMIMHGADLELTNTVGDTALLIAVKQRALGCAKILIGKGASLNRRNDQAKSARMLIEGLADAAWQALLDNAPSELESLFNRFTSR